MVYHDEVSRPGRESSLTLLLILEDEATFHEGTSVVRAKEPWASKASVVVRRKVISCISMQDSGCHKIGIIRREKSEWDI